MNIIKIRTKNFFDEHFLDRELIIRYLIAGGTGAFINLLSMYILTSILGIWYITSAIFAFMMSLLITFFIQKLWTFQDSLLELNHARRQAILYTIASTSFLVLNTLLLYTFVDFLGMWYLFAQFLSLGMVACGSFLFNKSVTFRKSKVNNMNEKQ